MKQKIISYLSTIKNEILGISKYIYENPEESFKEYKAYNYLIGIFENHNFNVTDSFINIPTAFWAHIGNGHPKICFTCEYDAIHDSGHIYGFNAASAMSAGAALGLAEVISQIGGSIIVIGCPGEITGSSKITMASQGVFEDIDAVLTVQPHTITAVSNTASTPENEFFSGGLPYKQLITNSTLNRLFSHNLKETGIIDISESKNIPCNLGLRNVSHIVPCLHSYINITEVSNIKYGTNCFGKLTLSDFANVQIMKVSTALALTGVDLIEKRSLISEIKVELYNKIKVTQNV